MAEPTEELWTYAGRRMRQGKMTAAWLTPEERHWSTKRTAPVVGGVYRVKVTRDDERMTMHGTPAFTGETIEEERRAVLQALDRDAYDAQRRAADEKRVAKTGGLDEALTPLSRVARECKSWRELDVLIAEVRRRMIAEWDRA